MASCSAAVLAALIFASRPSQSAAAARDVGSTSTAASKVANTSPVRMRFPSCGIGGALRACPRVQRAYRWQGRRWQGRGSQPSELGARDSRGWEGAASAGDVDADGAERAEVGGDAVAGVD